MQRRDVPCSGTRIQVHEAPLVPPVSAGIRHGYLSEEFAQQVEERTEGHATVRIYPVSQLGDWEEVFEQLNQGSVDLAIQSMSTKFDSRLTLTWFPYTAVDCASAKEAWNTGRIPFQHR